MYYKMEQYELEVYKVRTRKKPKMEKRVNNAEDAVEAFRDIVGEEIQTREHFVVLFMDNQNKLVGWYRFEGARNRTLVDIGLIGKCILDTLALGVIVLHNHPSGKCELSVPDKGVREKINDLCRVLESKMMDFIVVTDEGYESFMN